MKTTRRLQLARECLRQIWQIFDAGGHSIGRSEEAVLLEAAMQMIESDGRFSSEADADPKKFHEIVKNEIWQMRKLQQQKRDKELGIKGTS